MKVTRFAAFAALAALIATTVPGYASTTATGTITVKWNTALTANVVLHTGYTTLFAHNGVAATILTAANGGAGTCTTPDATNADLTVDFGSVAPDTGANMTDCTEEGALIIGVITNSVNWSLGMKDTVNTWAAGTFAGSHLCAYANNGATVGTKHGTFPIAAANITTSVPATAAVAPAANTFGTCGADPGGSAGTIVDSGGTTTNLVTGSAAVANTQVYVGLDLMLQLSSAALSGAHTTGANETVTLTAS